MSEDIDTKLHGVFCEMLNGMHLRGTGGVVHVKGDGCRYCFPREFSHEEFRKGLEEVVEDDDQHFYVVHEKDGYMHLLAYARDTVYRAAASSVAATTPPTTPTPDIVEDIPQQEA